MISRSTTPDNAIVIVVTNKQELFDAISATTYRIAQGVVNVKGEPVNPDSLALSADERSDFDRQLPKVFAKVCEAVQRWAPDEDRNLSVMVISDTTTTFNLQWGPVRMVPDSQVDVAINSYIEAIVLAWWWQTRNMDTLAELWAQNEEIRYRTLRSTLLSRNTKQINYRAY